MQFDLRSATDAGLHLLYDPASAMHLIEEPYDRWFKEVLEDGDDANLVRYSNGGDGDAKFRVFVDEQPDAELAERALAKRTGHLRVPSGRLFASGTEYLDLRGKPPPTAAEFKLRNPGMGSCELRPPGDYDVEAYDLNPESKKVEEGFRRYGESGAAKLSRHQFPRSQRGTKRKEENGRMSG